MTNLHALATRLHALTTRREVEDELTAAHWPRAAIEDACRATARGRHERRAAAAEEAARIAAGNTTAAAGLCELELAGLRAREALATTRMAWAAGLGKGRRAATDGDAWTAAIGAAYRALRPAGGLRWSARDGQLAAAPASLGSDAAGAPLGLPRPEEEAACVLLTLQGDISLEVAAEILGRDACPACGAAPRTHAQREEDAAWSALLAGGTAVSEAAVAAHWAAVKEAAPEPGDEGTCECPRRHWRCQSALTLPGAWSRHGASPAAWRDLGAGA